MFSLTKGASTDKYQSEAGFRVYFNAATSGNEEYSKEIYFDVLTSNNYSKYCADKSHTHTLSDIKNYAAPDLSPYALKSEIPDISGKADKTHTHTLKDITDFDTGWQKLFEENYISPVNTITYDSSTMSLNSVFNSVNDNSITMINDYPNKFWMSALFRLTYGRSFAIAVTKYSYYNKKNTFRKLTYHHFPLSHQDIFHSIYYYRYIHHKKRKHLFVLLLYAQGIYFNIYYHTP